MKNFLKLSALGIAGIALAACETSGGGGFTPPPGPSPVVGPPPVQKAQLPSSLRSADGDGISVRVRSSGRDPSQPVTLCLTTRSGMWKKEVGFGSVTLRSEGGTQDCQQTRANAKRLFLRKAKFAGVMTGVGNAFLDLSGWGGATIEIDWNKD